MSNPRAVVDCRTILAALEEQRRGFEQEKQQVEAEIHSKEQGIRNSPHLREDLVQQMAQDRRSLSYITGGIEQLDESLAMFRAPSAGATGSSSPAALLWPGQEESSTRADGSRRRGSQAPKLTTHRRSSPPHGRTSQDGQPQSPPARATAPREGCAPRTKMLRASSSGTPAHSVSSLRASPLRKTASRPSRERSRWRRTPAGPPHARPGHGQTAQDPPRLPRLGQGWSSSALGRTAGQAVTPPALVRAAPLATSPPGITKEGRGRRASEKDETGEILAPHGDMDAVLDPPGPPEDSNKGPTTDV